MGERLPWEIVEVSVPTCEDEASGNRLRRLTPSAAVAVQMLISSLIWAEGVAPECEESALDRSEAVASCTAEPAREHVRRDTNAGPIGERIIAGLWEEPRGRSQLSNKRVSPAYRLKESFLNKRKLPSDRAVPAI